jgi:AraC-like DNA-binding protein
MQRERHPGGLAEPLDEMVEADGAHGSGHGPGSSRRAIQAPPSHATISGSILEPLRHDLTVRYLDEHRLHVSKIAWLLGFREVAHACKRWTGKTPSQMRTAVAF